MVMKDGQLMSELDAGWKKWVQCNLSLIRNWSGSIRILWISLRGDVVDKILTVIRLRLMMREMRVANLNSLTSIRTLWKVVDASNWPWRAKRWATSSSGVERVSVVRNERNFGSLGYIPDEAGKSSAPFTKGLLLYSHPVYIYTSGTVSAIVTKSKDRNPIPLSCFPIPMPTSPISSRQLIKPGHQEVRTYNKRCVCISSYTNTLYICYACMVK